MFSPFFFFLFFLFCLLFFFFNLTQNRHQNEICSLVSIPEKCADPHSDVEATQVSSLKMSKVPGDLSNQKIQKKKLLHAGISEQNGLNLITGFPSMQESRISLNPCNVIKEA